MVANSAAGDHSPFWLVEVFILVVVIVITTADTAPWHAGQLVQQGLCHLRHLAVTILIVAGRAQIALQPAALALFRNQWGLRQIKQLQRTGCRSEEEWLA